MFRMEEALLEFKLAGIKSNKKNSCRYVSTKHKVKENVGLPLHGPDMLIMDNTVKMELLSFCLGLHGKSQLPSLFHAKKQQQS